MQQQPEPAIIDLLFAEAEARLLRTKDAAKYLSVSPWALRNLVRADKIPIVSLGEAVWRFDVQDLDKFIETHKQIGS